MLTRPQFAAACALALIAACATGQNGVKADEPAELSAKSQETLDRFELTGDARACVPTRRIRDIKALSEDLLLVRIGTNGYYLNRPKDKCEEILDRSSSIFYNIEGVPNLCSGEPVNVISNRPGTSGLVLGNCALGQFEELSEKDAG